MSCKPSQPKLRPTLADGLVLLCVVVLTVAVSFFVYRPSENTGALTAVISQDGTILRQVQLSALTEPSTLEVTGSHTTKILLERDGVSVTATDCPSQDCLHTGKITRAGQSIVCLPQHLVIHLEGSGGADLVLG
ncbi:MAG: NusG domain II-containing protein [Ruminococcaceae bacterium]|nr:NusG domain II-containing protein [Oscillospiraceae bacterium]